VCIWAGGGDGARLLQDICETSYLGLRFWILGLKGMWTGGGGGDDARHCIKTSRYTRHWMYGSYCLYDWKQ